MGRDGLPGGTALGRKAGPRVSGAAPPAALWPLRLLHSSEAAGCSPLSPLIIPLAVLMTPGERPQVNRSFMHTTGVTERPPCAGGGTHTAIREKK